MSLTVDVGENANYLFLKMANELLCNAFGKDNTESIINKIDAVKPAPAPKMKPIVKEDIEPDEKAEQLMDQIGDLFIQADELINSIREQFGIEDVYAEENFDDEEDDELSRSLWDDEEDYRDEEDGDEYEIVLNEVSKSALKTIGVENIDKQSINLMGTILIGISSEESDDAIAGRAFAQLVVSGYMLSMDDMKEMCKDTREKCKKQLFGLQIAYGNLREYQCSAEDALSLIQLFL